MTPLDGESNSARVADGRSKGSQTKTSTVAKTRATFTAADLFEAALDISGKSGLTIELAARVFCEELSLAPAHRDTLAEWMRRELVDSDHFLRQGNVLFTRSWPELERRVEETSARFGEIIRSVQHGLIDQAQRSWTARGEARLNAEYEKRLVARLCSTTSKNTRAPAARPAPKPRPPVEKPATKSLAQKPRPPVEKPAPAPPTQAAPARPPPAALEIRTAEIAGLEALAEQSSAGPLSVAALALSAHRLALREQFAELLAPRTFVGVDSHRYQIETVRRVLRSLRGRALLADEVGLGKTIEAILILREYQLRGMIRRVLILVPPALVAQWAAELDEKAGVRARTTDDAQFRAAPASFFEGDGVVIASLATARSARHAPAVTSSPWDMVIVDEAHRVKNRSSVSHKLVDQLKSRFLLLLTATPIENDLDEIYSLVTLLRPGQLTTLASFRRQFVDNARPTHPKNRETLRRLLGEVMVRNTRATCGLHLPPRFVTTVRIEPDERERELYTRVVDVVRAHAAEPNARLTTTTLLLEAGSSPQAIAETIRRIRENEKQSLAFRGALAELEAGYRALGHPRKSVALVEILTAHREPALIFTRYRATLEHLVRTLEEADVKCAAFHGGLDNTRKSAAIEAFKSGEARVLIATDAGAEGHNLQFCRLLISYDLPWNPMVIEQRIGRIHRMGQTGEVRVFNLCARGTIEDRVLAVLDDRLHLFELVVGEMDMVLGNIADERDLEERILDLVVESKTEEELAAGFDQLAETLESARGRYQQAKELDEAVFGEDFAT